MILRHKIIRRPASNENGEGGGSGPLSSVRSSGRSSGKRKAEEAELGSVPASQHPRRGLQGQRAAEGAPLAPVNASAAGGTGASSPSLGTAEAEAEAALLRLGGLEAAAGAEVQAQAAGGQHPLEQRHPQPPAPGSEEGRWLAAMQLSPLVDLRQLRSPLEAPGYGWPGGMATPRARPGVPRTPAGLQPATLGTPLSQHQALPTPLFLDFGEPAVAAKQGHWHSQHPAALRAHTVVPAAPAPADADALRPAATPQQAVVVGVPVMRAEPAVNPGGGRGVVLGLPLPLTAGHGALPAAGPPEQRPAGLPNPLAQPPRLLPSSAPAAATAAAAAPVVAPRAAPAMAAVPVVPAAAALAIAAPAAATALSAFFAAEHASLSRERARRARRQRLQSDEWDYSGSARAGSADSVGGGGFEEGEGEEEEDVATGAMSDSDSGGSSGSASTHSASGRQPKTKPKRVASNASMQQLVLEGGAQSKIQALQHLTAPQAAVAMGCSLAAFRKLCRSLGIARWPAQPRSRSATK